LKVYKTTINFQRAISGFLNDDPKCKDVINGLVLRAESNLSSSSKSPLLKHPRQLQVEGCRIEFQECVAYYPPKVGNPKLKKSSPHFIASQPATP